MACRANGATLTCSDAREHALGLRDCVLEEPGTQLVVDLVQKTLTHCCHQFFELRFLSQVEQRHEEEVTLNPGAWKSNSVRVGRAVVDGEQMQQRVDGNGQWGRRTVFATMQDWVHALWRRRDLGRMVQGLAEGE